MSGSVQKLFFGVGTRGDVVGGVGVGVGVGATDGGAYEDTALPGARCRVAP